MKCLLNFFFNFFFFTFVGNHVRWHCTVDTSTACVPCSALTYIDEPNGLNKCFPCSVCYAGEYVLQNKDFKYRNVF